MPPLAEKSAAEAWLGDGLVGVAAHFDAEWRDWIADRWCSHYEQLRQKRERLAELDAKCGEALSNGEAWEHAGLVEDMRSAEEALPMYRALLEQLPDSMNVNFAVGRVLVAGGDEAGIAFIERAIGLHENAIVPGSEWVVSLLRAQGREEEARTWIERWEAQRTKLEEDENDRGSVWFDERYGPHAVEAGRLGELVEFLGSQPEVERAWLLARETLHYPDRPMHVLIVRRKAGWQDWLSDEKEQAADHALQEALVQGPCPDGDYQVLVTNRLARKHRERMQGFPGTEIYPRSG